MIPVYALIMLFASRVLGPAFINLQDSEESIQMLQDEMINGILSVKASAAEGYFRKKILDKFRYFMICCISKGYNCDLKN